MATITVADTWFATARLDDDVTLIREPQIEWFIRANMWHVRGRDRDHLIDTGMGVRSLRRELAEDYLAGRRRPECPAEAEKPPKPAPR